MRIFYKRLYGGKCMEGLGEDGCTGEYMGSDAVDLSIVQLEKIKAYNKAFHEFAKISCASVPFDGMDYADIVGQDIHPDTKLINPQLVDKTIPPGTENEGT